jgi:hypothetical protein
MVERLLLLAARPVWGRFDHQRPGFDATHLWVVLGIVALIIGAAVAAYRSSRHRKSVFDVDSPAKLFRELCQAHQLSFRSRRLLKRLAAARGITDPARLFLEAQHFEAAHLPKKLQSAANEIRRLRDRLFA